MWRSAGVEHTACVPRQSDVSLPCQPFVVYTTLFLFAHSCLSDLFESRLLPRCAGDGIACAGQTLEVPKSCVSHTTSFCDAADSHSRCMTAVCPPAENTDGFSCAPPIGRFKPLPARPPSLPPAGVIGRDGALSPPLCCCTLLDLPVTRGVETFYHTRNLSCKQSNRWCLPLPFPSHYLSTLHRIHTHTHTHVSRRFLR